MELQFIVRYMHGSTELRMGALMRGYQPFTSGHFHRLDHHALIRQQGSYMPGQPAFREPPLFNFNVMSSVPYSVTIETDPARPQMHTQLHSQVGRTPSPTSQMARAQMLGPQMATGQGASAMVLPFYMHFVSVLQNSNYAGPHWYFCRFWIDAKAPPGFQGRGYHCDQSGRICFNVLLPT